MRAGRSWNRRCEAEQVPAGFGIPILAISLSIASAATRFSLKTVGHNEIVSTDAWYGIIYSKAKNGL